LGGVNCQASAGVYEQQATAEEAAASLRYLVGGSAE
jgi:hypothetical protein